MRPLHRLRDGVIARNRFAFLFAALVAFYVLLPIVQQLSEFIYPGAPPILEGLIFVTVLTAAVVSVSGSRTRLTIAVVLALPAVLLLIVNTFVVADALIVVQHTLAMAFLGYVIWVLLHFIFAGKRATFNTVCASLCIYFLLALLWAFAYSVVDVLDPGAFTRTAAATRAPEPLQAARGNITGLYFSFATLTTLGYGDIVPARPISRMLASVEAITGQLYLAVLVSRLVGLHIAESLDQRVSNESEEHPPEEGAGSSSD